MHRISFLAVTGSLFQITIAQNTTNTISPNNITCADLSPSLSWNATGSSSIQALSINGSNSQRDDEPFAVVNDTSSTSINPKTWTMYYRLQQQSAGSDKYTGRIFLETPKSTNLSQMGSCHQTSSPVDTTGKFLWTKEMLERSLKDMGNCRVTLGDACVDALKSWYREQAAVNHMRRGNCEKTNNTLPNACSGIMEPVSRREFSTTSSLRAECPCANPRHSHESFPRHIIRFHSPVQRE